MSLRLFKNPLSILVAAILVSSLQTKKTARASSCEAPDFVAASILDVGDYPLSAAVADFNLDGNPDLAVVNSLSSTVSVLIGKGDGTFRGAAKYSVGRDATFVTVGDFNGDHKPDMAVVNFNSANVSILLGNGDGTFQRATTQPVGATPFWAASADFNGDGKADLVVSHDAWGGTEGISVLLGRGDGTFEQAVNYSVGIGHHLYSGQVADFNGDGKLDVVVANSGCPLPDCAERNPGSFAVLLGNGDGTFRPPLEYVTGWEIIPNSIAVGDFDADTKLDVAVAYYNFHYAPVGAMGVLIFLGRGDGTFQPPGVEMNVGQAPVSIAVSDFNDDGKPDLVIANQDSDNVSILMGSGDGTFKPAINFETGNEPKAVVVGDFDHDAKPDLAVVHINNNRGPGYASVLLNTCVSAGPELTVSRAGRTNTFSWPLPSAGFVLEVSRTVDQADWRPFPGISEIKHGRREFNPPVTTLPLSFYRLRKP